MTDVDWPEIVAFLTACSMLLAGFAWLVREIVRREVNPRLEQMAHSMNGRMDHRIDRRIDEKLAPVLDQVGHINEELAKNLDGYRRAS